MPKATPSFLAKRRSQTIAVILLLGKIIPSYSRYAKEGLVYITITSPIN